ncbi:MAG: hypothetical protein WC718_15895, partial [Phycisphaerales bacterium]
ASIVAVQIIGTCDNTVRLENCHIENNNTGTGGYGHGLILGAGVSVTSPRIEDCYIKAGNNGAYSHGIYVGGKSNPYVLRTRTKGGGGGTDCMGAAFVEYPTGLYKDCYFNAGDGNTTCYGGYFNQSASPVFDHCDFRGGDGGNLCIGCMTGDVSSPQFNDCTVRGGSAGTGCRGIYVRQSAAPRYKGTKVLLHTAGYAKTGVTATTTMIGHATLPIRYLSMDIFVTTGTGVGSGGTVSIGTTLAGTEIVNAQAIEAAPAGNWSKVTLGSGIINVLGANAPLYITVDNGTGSAPALLIYYTYCIANTSCEAVYFSDAIGAWKLSGCEIESNPASDAVYATAATVTASQGEIIGCDISVMPRDTAAMKAINAEASWSPAPIYNCVLAGGTTNITAAAGTANGTNVEL